jgi:acetylornithine deacetylase/succinyl-diaminopimelate desuccinylase-like protein
VASRVVPLDADRGRWPLVPSRSADNKGQHALNLSALEAVLAERGGSLGFNLKLMLETSEERGSTGLRQFVAERADRLAAEY